MNNGETHASDVIVIEYHQSNKLVRNVRHVGKFSADLFVSVKGPGVHQETPRGCIQSQQSILNHGHMSNIS